MCAEGTMIDVSLGGLCDRFFKSLTGLNTNVILGHRNPKALQRTSCAQLLAAQS